MLSNARTSIASRVQRHAARALRTSRRARRRTRPKSAPGQEPRNNLFVSLRWDPRIAVRVVFIARRAVFIMANTCSECDARAPSFLPRAVTLSRSVYCEPRERVRDRCSDFVSASLADSYLRSVPCPAPRVRTSRTAHAL